MSEKKYYTVITEEGCWKDIHDLLCNETCGCDHIPDRVVECYDEVDHIERMGTYLLSDDEATLLKNHENVKYVLLSPEKYPEIYPKSALLVEYIKRSYDDIAKSFPKIYRDLEYFPPISNPATPNNPPASDNKRTNWAIKRAEESSIDFFKVGQDSSNARKDPGTLNYLKSNYLESTGITFKNSVSFFVADNQKYIGVPKRKVFRTVTDYDEEFTQGFSPIVSKYYKYEINEIRYQKTGYNVDVVIYDDGLQQYHPEYQDRANHFSGAGPFVGRSRVRDLILDGPYYLDPQYFDSRANLKTTKFDGRPTCTREGAILWWQSTTNRSSHFSTVGTISNARKILNDANYYEASVIGGPPAPGHEEPNLSLGYSGVAGNRIHGNGCAGVSCGLNYGSAVDARIWNVSGFFGGNQGLGSQDGLGYNFIKLFHQAKKACPNNIVAYANGGREGRVNLSPTIVNGSFTQSSGEYLRTAFSDFVKTSTNVFPLPNNLTGSLEKKVRNTTSNYTITLKYPDGLPSSAEASISNADDSFFLDTLSKGVGSRYRPSSQGVPGTYGYFPITAIAAEEMINSGVIFVVAAGNDATYMDNPSGDDYNNYLTAPFFDETDNTIKPLTTTFLDGTTTGVLKDYRNRRGSPSDFGGWDGTYNKTICVGAVEPRGIVDSDGSIKEVIAYFSCRGPGIDVFGPGGSDTLSVGNADLDAWDNFKIFSSGEVWYRYDSPNGKFNTSRSGRPTGKDINGDPLHTFPKQPTDAQYRKYGLYVDQSFGGTSCATPITTGIIALYLEENPSATYKDVQRWIRNTGSVKANLYNPYSNRNDPKFFKSVLNLCNSADRIIHNPYVSKRYKLVVSDTSFVSKAESVPSILYTQAGLDKQSSVNLFKNPPSSAASNYTFFLRSLEVVDDYIQSPESQIRKINIGFGGRNNGGNAKFERQQDGTKQIFAAGGGGGAGFYGGGGANTGGGGGGGSGLAREDASVANNKTRQGGNSGDGYVRIWINEKADGSRDTWNQDPLTR